MATPGVPESVPCPYPSQKRLSPLADTECAAAGPAPVARSTVTSYSIVNRPRYVALPEPVPFTANVLGGSNWSVSTPDNVPLKGNCCCATAETANAAPTRTIVIRTDEILARRTTTGMGLRLDINLFMVRFPSRMRCAQRGAAGLIVEKLGRVR